MTDARHHLASVVGTARSDADLPGDLDPEVVAAVEHFAFAAVGVTERSLAATATLAELSLPQWRVLTLLHRARAPLRLADVAGAAGLSASSASRMVARLAGRGLIVTAIDLADRRAIGIRLTRAGGAVVRAVISARRQEIVERLADLHLAIGFARDLESVASAIDGPPRATRPSVATPPASDPS